MADIDPNAGGGADTKTGADAGGGEAAKTGEDLLGAAGNEPAKTGADEKSGQGTGVEKNPEQVAADEKVAKEAADKTAAESEAKLKEPYQDFKVPDGVVIDKALLTTFSPIMRKHGLSQEAAQEFVGEFAKVRAAEADAWVKQVQEWANESRADKEISGGQGFDVNVMTAQTAIRDLFPDLAERKEFVGMLQSTGLHNNKLMIKAFMRSGQRIADDKIVHGNNAGPAKSLAHRMYPNEAPK